MVIIYLGFIGFLAFILGVGIFGLWLRRHPSKVNAEKTGRIMHFLFFAGLVTPGLVIIFYPGLRHLDDLFGLNPLPNQSLFLVTGIILAIPGIYFMVVSNQLLRRMGSGANAFRLTECIVDKDIYQYTRNPMSLGYYLCCLSMGLISGSSVLTFVVLVGVVPAHIFFLKFFEELELELRFGEPYKRYKQRVAFIIPKKSPFNL